MDTWNRWNFFQIRKKNGRYSVYDNKSISVNLISITMYFEHIELIVEFTVILLAPIIHNYYLWKVKKVDASVIQQNIKIFSFFYVLIAIVGALLLQAK